MTDTRNGNWADGADQGVVQLSTQPQPGEKYRVMLAWPVGQHSVCPEAARWSRHLYMDMALDPLIERVVEFDIGTARILMNRNNIAQHALKTGCRWLVMCDPDMHPDLWLGVRDGLERFWTSSFYFARDHAARTGDPCIVGAPAMCGPPQYPINVFRQDGSGLRHVTHAEVGDVYAGEPAMERVVAIGTGLMLIDTEIFKRLPQPWFDDLYQTAAKDEIFMSQDVYFCTEATRHGLHVYANWYAPCGHYKTKCLGLPGLPDPEAAQQGQTRQRTVELHNGQAQAPAAGVLEGLAAGVR